MSNPIEPFVVRHYVGDQFPSLKGNGFDGLALGEDRERAEEFVKWINARLVPSTHTQPKCEYRFCPDCGERVEHAKKS